MNLVAEIRDRAVLGATFWRKTVTNGGIRLSLRGASPRMRTALQFGYELEDARLCSRFLEPSDRVLELGSSIGFLALYCLKRIGVAGYAMVEANPYLADTIAKNFALNGMTVPHLFNVAAGPEEGEVSFNVNRDFWSSSVLDRANAAQAVTVPQRTIPSLIADLPFAPNVLIMDIEGGETRIPLDHWTLFDKVIVEFHARMVGQDAIDRIVNHLKANGFVEAGEDRRSVAFVRKRAE